MSRVPAEIAAAFTTSLVPWGTIALSVIFIAVATAVMIWMILRIAKDSERMEKDSRFRVRKLRGGAILYVFSLLFGIVSVIRGEIPAWALLFSAPIPLMFIWLYIRARETRRIRNIPLPKFESGRHTNSPDALRRALVSVLGTGLRNSGSIQTVSPTWPVTGG